MRIVNQDDHPLLLNHRPYQGALGAALYVAAVDPLADPGPTSIEFRRSRTLDGTDGLIAGIEGVFALGAASVPKSPAVAFVDSPTAEIRYAIPVAWHGKTIWAQVRTHAQDYENETLFRPRRITLDGSGDDDTPVYGRATVTSLEKRDGGGLLIRFTYSQPRDGLIPELFVLTKASGAGSIMPGTAPYVAGALEYVIEVTGLTNGVAYTFTLSAEAGAVTTPLVTAIGFTGDAAGPPAVTLSVEEW